MVTHKCVIYRGLAIATYSRGQRITVASIARVSTLFRQPHTRVVCGPPLGAIRELHTPVVQGQLSEEHRFRGVESKSRTEKEEVDEEVTKGRIGCA